MIRIKLEEIKPTCFSFDNLSCLPILRISVSMMPVSWFGWVPTRVWMPRRRPRRREVYLRFLVDYPTARMLLRRLQLFSSLEALPGLCWFGHFEWDGKLYLLEELGSRVEAAAMLNSCDHESVALLDQAQMRIWMRVLKAHADLALV